MSTDDGTGTVPCVLRYNAYNTGTDGIDTGTVLAVPGTYVMVWRYEYVLVRTSTWKTGTGETRGLKQGKETRYMETIYGLYQRR